MNIDQLRIDETLVRRLVDTQFPKWKALPIRPVALSGWDNRTFHLGEEMLVRMPSAAEYEAQVEKEHRWLPKLAPFLPLPIPVPLAMGEQHMAILGSSPSIVGLRETLSHRKQSIYLI